MADSVFKFGDGTTIPSKISGVILLPKSNIELTIEDLNDLPYYGSKNDYQNYTTNYIAGYFSGGIIDEKYWKSNLNMAERTFKNGDDKNYENLYNSQKKVRIEKEEAERLKKEEEERKNALQKEINDSKGKMENPPIGNENIITLSFPPLDRTNNKEYSMLFDNGCYYFKLSYAPNYQMNKDMQWRMDETISKKFTEILGKGGEALNKWVDELRTSNSSDLLDAAKNSLANILQNTGASIGDNLVQAVAGAYAIQNASRLAIGTQLNELATDNETFKSNINDSFISLYNNQALETAIVFLPLNSMTVKRESGVGSSTGIVKSMIQKKMIESNKSAEDKTGLSGALQGRGYSENQYRGITTSGANYESYNLEWKLMPKNSTEMKEILNMLIYFQCACVSNLDLNDRTNKKWILPPVCEIGIMSSRLQNGDKDWDNDMIDSYSFNDIRNNRNFSKLANDTMNEERNTKTWNESNQYDIFNEQNKNLRILSPDTEKLKNVENRKQKVRWLKKPVSIYIKDVEITPLMNDGGVLLSPEGFPMGVSLKVSVMRTTLTSLDDLWSGDKSRREVGSLKNANPFA